MKDKYSKYMSKTHYQCLTEEDFYPPSDDRIFKSNIEDIEDGDNFADYCIEFFKMLEEEGHYE